jgi:hypothetical protein
MISDALRDLLIAKGGCFAKGIRHRAIGFPNAVAKGILSRA